MAARNVADLVRAAAAADPAKPALLDGDRTITWKDLDDLVERAAAGFRAAGATTGDRIGILLPNCIEFAVAYFGALRAGQVAVPLNVGFTADELDYQLRDAAVSQIVTDVEGNAGLDGLDVASTVVVGAAAGGWEEFLDSGAEAPADGNAPDDAVGDEDLALLLYTSGTSGRPRGAMLSHRALLANLDQLASIDPPIVAGDDRVLLVLPLFHVYGLNAGLGMVAKTGSTGVLARRFDPVETLTVVRDNAVSCVIGAPPMYVAWAMLPDLRQSLAGVRLALSGAAPLPAAVATSIRDSSGVTVFEGYGLTETAPVLTTTLCSPQPKLGSVGRPVPGVEVRIIDDADDEVDEHDPGELVVRGANLFSGYWPDGSEGPDAEGWFRTGDIAYADADGDLFLVDRTKELILVSGFNVYPREVEQVLREHPDVAEVAVIGAPHPYTGETVKALVVPRAGATNATTDALIEFCAGRLARFKCPTVVEFVDELPHSLTGKVAKGRLREAQPDPQ